MLGFLVPFLQIDFGGVLGRLVTTLGGTRK